MKTAQLHTFKYVVDGFDVELAPSEDDENSLFATIYELGNKVYEIEIPVEEDEEQAINSEPILDYAAQAAVDIFEASRNTLDQGAGATMKKNTSIDKKAYCVSPQWENWYAGLKGTAYEEQATQMLEQLMELSAPDHAGSETDTDKLYSQEMQILYELDVLNFERMKKHPAGQTVIIIQGSRKVALYGVEAIEEYLEKFRGCSLEQEAISKIRELLDVRAAISNANQLDEDRWEQTRDLELAMQELAMQALQESVEATTSPVEEFPQMAADIEDLMDGVTLEEPLEPMMIAKKMAQDWLNEPDEYIVQLGQRPVPDYLIPAGQDDDDVNRQFLGMVSDFMKDLEEEYSVTFIIEPINGDSIKVKPSFIDGSTTDYAEFYQSEISKFMWDKLNSLDRSAKKALNEDAVTGGEQLEELGELHEGIDIAEVPVDEYPFNVSERVEITKNFEYRTWGGAKTLNKGTKGTIDDLFDRHGNIYYVKTDDGKLIKVPYTHLKRLKKSA